MLIGMILHRRVKVQPMVGETLLSNSFRDPRMTEGKKTYTSNWLDREIPKYILRLWSGKNMPMEVVGVSNIESHIEGDIQVCVNPGDAVLTSTLVLKME